MNKNNFWVIKIALLTFLLAIVMSILSNISLRSTNLFFASILLILIIFIGIFFDMIGIAIAAVDPSPFYSMASQKVKGSKQNIYLIKNASMVANICNDVVGDIAGIISGAASAIIISKIMRYNLTFLNKSIISILLTAIVASLTVGGKAVGKIVGISYANEIIMKVGKVIYYFDKLFKIDR